MGIAYSSVISSLTVFLISFLLIWFKLGFNFSQDIIHGSYNFKWLKTWSKIGFFSGLDSFIRNAVYLVVVLRAMNKLNEQGNLFMGY